MYNVPYPIGYVEVQRAWVGDAKEVATMIPLLMEEIRQQMARETPAMRQFNSRCEHTKDGAGVNHYTLYVGFAPAPQEGVQTTEPLDPRNLNDAKNPDQIGDPARDNFIGMKEQRF